MAMNTKFVPTANNFLLLGWYTKTMSSDRFLEAVYKGESSQTNEGTHTVCFGSKISPEKSQHFTWSLQSHFLSRGFN